MLDAATLGDARDLLAEAFGAVRTATAESSTTMMRGNPPDTLRIRGKLYRIQLMRRKKPRSFAPCLPAETIGVQMVFVEDRGGG
jgi:hypothetical protein